MWKYEDVFFVKKKLTTILLWQNTPREYTFQWNICGCFSCWYGVLCEKVRQPILHVKRKSSLYVCYLPRIVSLTVKTHNTRIFNWMHRMFCSIEFWDKCEGGCVTKHVFSDTFCLTYCHMGNHRYNLTVLGEKISDLKWKLRNLVFVQTNFL